MQTNQIILYQPNNQATKLKVRLNDDTVWLNRQQIAILFNRDIKTIGKHINNALKEELSEISVVAKFATTATDGKVYQVEHYNLDMVMSVGYRVKSKRGVQFRIWANKILKDYLLKGYAINQRVDKIERKLLEHDQKFDLIIKTALPPVEGIFYDGQIFDAWQFVSGLTKNANKSIVLIDNYIDESVLTLFTKRKPDVSVTIYTANISAKLKLDIDKFNAQYSKVKVNLFTKAHDRFLIIDNKTVYYIGASLKDLGKKWFAFSKINIDAIEMIAKLEQ